LDGPAPLDPELLADPDLIKDAELPDWYVKEQLGKAKKAKDAKASNRVKSYRMDQVEAKAVLGLWPGWIPQGMLTVLDGDPDLGKSTVLLDLAARVSSHGVMPNDVQGPTGHVLIMSAEDDRERVIKPRLLAAGADLARVECIEEVDGHLLRIPRDVRLIEAKVWDSGAVLLIVDPLMAWLEAESRSDQEVRQALHPLHKMAAKTGCTVICQRHLNKGGGTKALYRGGGSIGIIAAARAGILIAQDPDSPEHRVMAQTKNNLGLKQQSLRYRLEWCPDVGACRVVWCGTSDCQADDLLAPPASAEEKSKKEEAAELLQELLAKGPRPAEECYEEGQPAGFGKMVMWRAKEHLGVKATAEKDQDGKVTAWVWQL
jgi:RecA-family ATPase